jgi:hypothetical protein
VATRFTGTEKNRAPAGNADPSTSCVGCVVPHWYSTYVNASTPGSAFVRTTLNVSA